MSNNSPTVTIRVPPLTKAAIEERIAEINKVKEGKPVTMTQFLLYSATEMLDKPIGHLAGPKKRRTRKK